MRHVLAIALAVAIAASTAAQAEAPPGTDPASPLAHWVRSIRHRAGWSCCSESDCRPTTISTDADGRRWAWIGKEEYGAAAPDARVPIPQAVIDDTISDGAPPDGRSWVCYYAGQIHCAVILDLF